ncbi:hypothetical protein AWB68_04261 [Caballeronia choica]|uniref:Uncharacterized protein n=1 Tax=Caballeronia choica TaxID=326476 RepID=A0A158JVN4_9BURK|nr:hypothetical protein AWB68_04261 [Caballeronia choica]
MAYNVCAIVGYIGLGFLVDAYGRKLVTCAVRFSDALTVFFVVGYRARADRMNTNDRFTLEAADMVTPGEAPMRVVRRRSRSLDGCLP